jgi:hypothetical protein
VLSLSSLSFLSSRVNFGAPRFPTSQSKHFLLEPPLCAGSGIQSEFLHPDGNFVENPPDFSCSAVAGVWLPSKTLLLPHRH